MRFPIPIISALILVAACTEPTSDPTSEGTATGPMLAGGPPVPTYSVLDLGTLGGRTSSAADIDETGTVVGSSETTSGETHGFRWTEEEGMVELPPLPGHTRSVAVQAYPDGSVFGSSTGAGVTTPVLWDREGTPTPIDLPTELETWRSFSVEARGRDGALAGSGILDFRQRAWYWSPTTGFVNVTATTPGGATEGWAHGIGKGGYVIGHDRPRDLCDYRPGEFGGLCIRTYLWHPVTGYLFIGSPDHSARTEVLPGSANANGEVAATADNFGPGTVPFRWSAAEGFVFLSTPEGEGGANGINGAGTVVGEVHRPGRQGRATIWTKGGDRIELTVEDSLPAIGWRINDRGQVVGRAPFNGAVHAALWRPQP